VVQAAVEVVHLEARMIALETQPGDIHSQPIDMTIEKGVFGFNRSRKIGYCGIIYAR